MEGLCDIPGCRRKSVAYCTKDTRAEVCNRHFLPAAGNDFRPIRFGEFEYFSPEDAATVIRAGRMYKFREE